MERVLGYTLWIVMVLGTTSVTLLGRSGGLESRAAWTQLLAAPFGLWFLLVPVAYAAICAVSRRSTSSAIPLKMAQGLGVILVLGFLAAYAWIILVSGPR